MQLTTPRTFLSAQLSSCFPVAWAGRSLLRVADTPTPAERCSAAAISSARWGVTTATRRGSSGRKGPSRTCRARCPVTGRFRHAGAAEAVGRVDVERCRHEYGLRGSVGRQLHRNLTPDVETGLGRWTADTFIAALRTGRHEGKGRPILPPMPYKMIRTLTDEDLRSIFAYLQSLPPIRNRVPTPVDPEDQK